MDDVATVIVLRDIGGNAWVDVAGDVLTADHEAEVFARIECHARWSQGDFDFHDFALRQFLVAVETLHRDDVGAELLVKMATADAQATVGTTVLRHAAMVFQHVMGTRRG